MDKTRVITSIFALAAVIGSAHPPVAYAGDVSTLVTDNLVTENTDRWNKRHVPNLAISTDAKVGKHSLVGTFGHSHHITLNSCSGMGRSWNLTGFEKLRFWAKSDKKSDNLLVMLWANGLKNRRDALISLTTEWKLYELPFDEKAFCKNAQGKFAFTRVRTVAFYNNCGAQRKIWLDGLEFAGPKKAQVVVAKELEASSDASAKTLSLLLTDPFEHIEQAKRDKHKLRPRYDLPLGAFNMDNAFKDAIVNFDRVRDWKAIVRGADGYMCLSMDQTLRKVPNLKIEIIPTGKKPRITLIPPKPIKIGRDFDVIECWAYAHKHGAKISFQFRRKDGSTLVAGTNYSDTNDDVNPKSVGAFWNLVRIVMPKKVERGAELLAIHISPNLSKRYKDPTCLLHFDQLRVFSFSEYMKQPPPQFKNVGKIVDNFPVHPDGACPKTVGKVQTAVKKVGIAWHLSYTTRSGEQTVYIYTPKTGTFSDIAIAPKNKSAFRPADGSGPVFDFGGKACDVASGGARVKLISCKIEGKKVKAVWRYTSGAASETIAYEFSLKGKTLQISAKSDQRFLSQWKFGVAKGVKDARVIELPFMLYTPNVLLTDGIFVTYYADWYRSNVSMMPYGAESYVKGDTAAYNWRRDQKYAYYKRTDGKRHPLREVFYITASSNFDDVMLTVSNPPSPMKHIVKKRLFRMIDTSGKGAIGRTRSLVDLCDKYGMTNTYLLFHTPIFWRRNMGSEAFPGDMTVGLHHGKDGDKKLKDLFAHMRKKGIFPGYYDGYPARDVTAKSFHYDWTTYQSNGTWNKMWRCPALKPWTFPELAGTLYKARAKKFGARVSYQDGITAWIITYMNDYDHRYPESGTLRETMRALATGWQRSRENMNGPVFSEGRGSDFYTAGLVDGDYAKLKGYWDDKDCTEDRVRLLVDFRLRKTGPLWTPVGLNIGYAGFAPSSKGLHYNTFHHKSKYEYLHHYMTAQIAFATIGMLEPYWTPFENPKRQFDKTITCYFMMQQLQERYIMEEVEDIKYFDGSGKLLSTSDALRADIVKDNHVHIRYKNGLELYLNMNWDGKNLLITDGNKTYNLPPGGWYAKHGDDFLEFSALIAGRRVDFSDGPNYTYVNPGDKPFTRGALTVPAGKQYIRHKKGPLAGKKLLWPK